MKKSPGFSRFEFYVVISVISLIALFGIQRYSKLAGEAQRLGVEALAQNFSAAVYNYRSRWIIEQQRGSNLLKVGDILVQFSAQGWPMAVLANESPYMSVTISSCLSMWKTFLQNPPALSYEGGDTYGTHVYHLVISSKNVCRFEWAGNPSKNFYFEYSPISGEVSVHTSL